MTDQTALKKQSIIRCMKFNEGLAFTSRIDYKVER
jgi:hypothetical protein